MESHLSPETTLLPSNALANVRLGISVSDSPDLARLGLLETHFRLALGEIARCVLVSGGHLAYGGHLHPDGYTAFLMQELSRYSRRDRPFHVYLAWQEHRKLSLTALKAEEKSLGLHGKFVFLNPRGAVVDAYQNRSEDPPAQPDSNITSESLTAMRRYMAAHTHGRIFIGGRRAGFQGDLPGLIEESLLALEAGQPIYLAGGFGGATADIARTLGIDDGSWLIQRSDAPSPDDRYLKALADLAKFPKTNNWAGIHNGLTDEENKKLAASHRPSEIATLISLGLGRRFFGTNG
jgi:hypothetical protein